MKRALTYNKFPLVSLAMFYPQYGFVQSSEILFSEVRPWVYSFWILENVQKFILLQRSPYLVY